MNQSALTIREPNKRNQWRRGSLTKIRAEYSNINCTARDPQRNLRNSGEDGAVLATLAGQLFLAARTSTQERHTINLDAPTFARSIPDASDARIAGETSPFCAKETPAFDLGRNRCLRYDSHDSAGSLVLA
jgi:hypothetical protein